MSKHLPWLGAGIVLLALAVIAADRAFSLRPWDADEKPGPPQAPIPLRPGVTEVNVGRVKVGMTPKEVEAILGGPPTSGRIANPGELEVQHSWSGDTGWAEVWFDRYGDGGVVAVRWRHGPSHVKPLEPRKGGG
jgi:hypothetical protein